MRYSHLGLYNESANASNIQLYYYSVAGIWCEPQSKVFP
jgi:hypothetical protein